MNNTNIYDKSFPVSWEEIHRNSKALAWRLSELKPYKGIIAVTRGGLVPAAIVARELDIRLIDTFCVLSYNQKNKGDVKVLKDYIKSEIEDAFDHKNLNLDIPYFKDIIPTTENLAIFIWNKLNSAIKLDCKLSIVLYETPRNYVEYSG